MEKSRKISYNEIVMQKSHNGMEIRSKLWIEMDGDPVFGRGRRFLLQAIDSHGSINQAAKEVGISFRKAWSHIKAMEERLGIKLVDRQAGGKNGGGATLTEDARVFLKNFEEMEEGIREIVDERFKKFSREAPMCDTLQERHHPGVKTIPVHQAVGAVLAHDITEIRQHEFKGRAFRKGHIIREEDICHLQRLGKEHLFVLQIAPDEMHEDDAAYAIARALMGDGVAIQGEPREGKINLIADRDGLLKIHQEALLALNMLGDVMCATLHNNTRVQKGAVVAGTRAIPLVVKKAVVDDAVMIAEKSAEFPPHPRPLPLGRGRKSLLSHQGRGLR